MSKFGEIIHTELPVLISFYIDKSESAETMHPVIRRVAASLSDKARVVKIELQKNPELAEALQIKSAFALAIYKNEQMVWKQTGIMDAETIITAVESYL